MGHAEYDPVAKERRPWNAGRKLGAKRALKSQQVWAIRFWFDRERRLRDRAMFDLAIDSKLRGCDIVKIKIGDLVSRGRVRSRAIVVQQKTGRPVQFELLEPARGSLLVWFECRGGALNDYAFPSRIDHADHISTRQYARLVDEWVTAIGLRREILCTRVRVCYFRSHYVLRNCVLQLMIARALLEPPPWYAARRHCTVSCDLGSPLK
jgi:integrase